MKRALFLIALCVALMIVPVLTQAQGTGGVSVTCDNGTSFDNGIEIVVHQMRAGYTYKATAIGINGFDPVLAVLNSQTGEGLCSDDEPNALNYEVDLPTTGYVPGNTTTAQLNFHHNDRSGFEDISLVVGGYDNETGEFVLVLEGMGVTPADGAGDPFSVYLTPGMVASQVPLTVYMITRGGSSVDPLLYLASDDTSLGVMTDSHNDDIYCDDANDFDKLLFADGLEQLVGSD